MPCPGAPAGRAGREPRPCPGSRTHGDLAQAVVGAGTRRDPSLCLVYEHGSPAVAKAALKEPTVIPLQFPEPFTQIRLCAWVGRPAAWAALPTAPQQRAPTRPSVPTRKLGTAPPSPLV